jgi:predicted HTH transcriptional regulator
MGTGTADMIRIAKENKLQTPVFKQNEDFKIVIYRPSSDQLPTKQQWNIFKSLKKCKCC